MDSKIKRTIKVIGGILLIISGWLALGIGFTIQCAHPCNTMIFMSGFVCMILGIVLLTMKKKQHTTR